MKNLNHRPKNNAEYVRLFFFYLFSKDSLADHDKLPVLARKARWERIMNANSEQTKAYQNRDRVLKESVRFPVNLTCF